MRSALVGAALVVLSAVGFSGKAVLAKVLYRKGVDPLSVIALRMGFSLPVFASLALRNELRSARLSASDLLAVLSLGAVGYYASVYGDFAGLAYISAGLERLVMFTYPTLVLLMAALVHRQRISVLQVGCLVLTYAGIALAF
ncbi:MAG TPA: DMT family transporter, partial [Polyangiaceae bacterium]|nr:DMT family transporter [Polyangiaceae bacterium]